MIANDWSGLNVTTLTFEPKNRRSISGVRWLGRNLRLHNNTGAVAQLRILAVVEGGEEAGGHNITSWVRCWKKSLRLRESSNVV